VLPAACVGNRLAAPDTSGAVEVEEQAGAVAAAVLEHEVRVEQDRLDLRQQRVVVVDVTPPRLHHGHLLIDEERHGAAEEVAGGDEVGVEDGDEPASRHLHAGLECASLVAGAVGAMQILDVDALGGVAADGLLGYAPGFVGGVVEDLDFEQLARVIQLAHRVNEAVRNVHLVVDRQLHGDHGQLAHRARRLGLLVLVLHVQVHQVVAVPPIHGQNDQYEEIRRECESLRKGHSRPSRTMNTTHNYMASAPWLRFLLV